MPSDIDATKPEQGNATTLSVRENFAAAKAEILDLQGEDTAINTRVDTRAERAGDIGGTTTSSTVVAIQNRAVSGATPAPTAGQPLTWQATPAPGHWEPMNVIQVQGVAVSATAPTNGQQLRYDTTAPAGWKATTNTVAVSGDVTGTGDASAGAITTTVERIRGRNVLATAPTNSQALVYNGTDWTPGPVTQLQGRPVNATAPSAGQGLIFSGTEWTPTSGAAATQALAFRAMTPDLHDWIPSGTEGLFAGDGTAITNAPDAGKWRYIAEGSAAAGSLTILAMSDGENGKLLQKTNVGGVWSDWADYPANVPNAFIGPNLTPNGPLDTTDFTQATPGLNNWEQQWVASTSGLNIAYALTSPTIANHWYRLDFTWYSGLPTTTAFLRTSPTATAGQQQVITVLYPPTGSGTTMSYWTGQVTGAFTHLVFVNPSSGQGPGAPRLREFNPDVTVELLTGQPATPAGWTHIGGSGPTAQFGHASGNTDALIYPLTGPLEVGRLYFFYWALAPTLGQYAVSVFLRVGATNTTGQLSIGTENDNRPGEPGWGNVRRIATPFTHIAVVPNTTFTGTFAFLHVCPAMTVPSGFTNLLSRIDASNFILGNATLPLDGGMNNLAVGLDTMSNATTAMRNLAIGQEALLALTGGQNNVALGYRSLRANTGGANNIAIGQNSLLVATGSQNVAIGSSIAVRQTSASSNILIGYLVALNQTTGASNVIIGSSAGRANTTGSSIVAIGTNALYASTAYAATGQTCVGASSLYSITSGTYNTALGNSAMYSATTASNCVAVGYNAGRYRTGTTGETDHGTTGSIYIGHNSRTGGTGRTNQIVIGVGADGQGTNTVYLGNTDTLATNGLFCRSTTIVQPSDVRLKEDVVSADLDKCLDAVKSLPVRRFHWNEAYSNCDDDHVTGFIADDVEAVFPKSVLKRDQTFNGTVIKDCKMTGLDQALPTLWGAVQKLIQENDELKAEIAELKEHKNGRK